MALFDPSGHDDKGQAPAGERALEDRFGRHFAYLRLSLTQRCNFRCSYCLPNGFVAQKGLPPELSRDEIRRAVAAFAKLGLWKVRLTGGEPTVRTDFTELAQDIASLPGIRRLAMTTNGYRLAREAESWRQAGIDAVNVSVDTLDRTQFAKVTGQDMLDKVIDGIDAALGAGFESVKVNSVLLPETGHPDTEAILDFISERDVTWRFIELMRTNGNAAGFRGQADVSQAIRNRLERTGWTLLQRGDAAGPAAEYSHPDYRGRIGLITPYGEGFCDSCNRLRLSSRGKLHLCLFGEQGLDLRDLLQADDQQDELRERIAMALPLKTQGHRLHEGNSGATPHLASIGG